MRGGESEALDVLNDLATRGNGTIIDKGSYGGLSVEFPGGGYAGYRISSEFGPTIDVNFGDIPFFKIHFVP